MDPRPDLDVSEKSIFVLMPGLEPGFLGHSARSLLTVPTESSQLAFHFRFIFYVFARLGAHNGAAGSLILNMTPSVLVYV